MKKSYIVENSATCAKCGENIVSKTRHDFVECKCGSIFVDGGQDYLRRGGQMGDIQETSILMEEEAVIKCVEAVKWAKETGRNDLGTALAVIRAVRDSGYLKKD